MEGMTIPYPGSHWKISGPLQRVWGTEEKISLLTPLNSGKAPANHRSVVLEFETIRETAAADSLRLGQSQSNQAVHRSGILDHREFAASDYVHRHKIGNGLAQSESTAATNCCRQKATLPFVIFYSLKQEVEPTSTYSHCQQNPPQTLLIPFSKFILTS